MIRFQETNDDFFSDNYVTNTLREIKQKTVSCVFILRLGSLFLNCAYLTKQY